MSSEAKTVRVRVAVVVSPDGEWAAAGWDNPNDDDSIIESAQHTLARCMSVDRVVWLEATLPLPLASTVEADVVGEMER